MLKSNIRILLLPLTLTFLSLVSGGFVNPEDVVKGETYALSLSSDSLKVLDSSSGTLFAKRLKNGVGAADVGNDNGQRWQFCDGIPPEGGSVYSVGGGGEGGYLTYFHDDTVGGVFYDPPPPKILTTGEKTDDLVMAHRQGEGIKLKLPTSSDEWVNWMGDIGSQDDSALWMITKTTPRDGWEAKCQ